MYAIVVVGYSTKSLHMDFLAIFAIKSLCQEMCSAIFFYQRTFRHLYPTFLYQFIKGIFQPAIIFRFLKTCLG